MASLGAISSIPGSLTDLAFISSCPPAVQPNTRIIALCGITDWRASSDEPHSSENSQKGTICGAMDKLIGKGKELFMAVDPWKTKHQKRKEAEMLKTTRRRGRASPINDGWFFSDFFLFHHLFRGLGASQRWYTCEDPEVLVARYGQYAHGEAASDRRVVLNKDMLGDMKAAGNIHVSLPNDLRQDFITYFKAESKLASQKNEPILLMIFGHGEPKVHGIAVGGLGDPRSAPRLRLEDLEIPMHGLDTSLTLLMPAYYSGGWLIRPNVNVHECLAAGNGTPGYSRKASLGHSFHGSVWATAVMESLIKMEDSKATQYQPSSSGFDLDRLDENVKSSTFASLGDIIARTLQSEMNARDVHKISFAAQDDEWAKEWRDRSCIPLGRFEAQWNKLPRRVPQAVTGQGSSATGGIPKGATSSSTAGPSSSRNEHGFRKSLKRRQADTILADLCHRYLNTCPPAPESGDDILPYRAAEQILNEHRTSLEILANLQATLSYRLDAADLATTFKDLTLTKDQSFPPCHSFTWEDWIATARKRSKREAFNSINKLLRDAELLDSPTFSQGYSYSKFYHYLAAAYAENNLDREAVNAAIATMQAYKKAQVQAITERIRYDRTVRNSARVAFSSLGKRLRSPSPQKRGVIPRFSDEIRSF